MEMTELLDDLEQSIDGLVMDCMAYTICPECGHVDDEEETLRNHPCQTCGVNVSIRQVLFYSEERIIEMIFECYRGHSKEICVLLFCTLIEHQLRNLIISRCRRLNLGDVIVDLLLDKYWRVPDRLKLFERLSGTSIRTAVATLPVKQVFDAYNLLFKKRNGLAHGLPGATYDVTKEDVSMSVNQAANSFSMMAQLHHCFCAIDSPPLPAT